MRTFGRVPSLRTVVGVLFKAIHQLRISFLFVIVLFIFSCIAEQLFHGKLRLTCVQEDLLPGAWEVRLKTRFFGARTFRAAKRCLAIPLQNKMLTS